MTENAPGTATNVGIFRNGQEQTITVTLGEPPRTSNVGVFISGDRLYRYHNHVVANGTASRLPPTAAKPIRPR